LTDDEFELRAKIVVNASGPWLWRLVGLVNESGSLGPTGFSKSFNLLVRRRLTSDAALGVYGQSRFLFITPWRGGSLVGTAHLPYGASPDDVIVSDIEIQAFLDQINDAYPAAELTRRDVDSVYAGLVPASTDKRGEAQLMKRYRIYDHEQAGGPDGLISVSGVKFTEARYVAEKVVDQVMNRLGRKLRPSTTAVTPVYGGRIERFDEFLADQVQRPTRGLSEELLRHLVHSYGSAYPEILGYLDTGPASDDARADMGRVIRAETRHAIRDEMAEKLGDVVFRRITDDLTGLSRSEVVTHCADVMAAEFGWSEARTQQELQAVCSSSPARLS
jgi:glycerol-3-phosphate dehydrogenase